MQVASPEPVVRAVATADVDVLTAYLEDHLKDNGRGGAPLFQPQSRQAAGLEAGKMALFRAGLGIRVGEPGWRRAWVAIDSSGAIAGHTDLRGRPEPCSAHRALLGLGVHRRHRGHRLGRALVEHALAWATRSTQLEWIDLTFLSGNVPAERLYRSLGFVELATIADMYRIDGESVDDIWMTRRIAT